MHHHLVTTFFATAALAAVVPAQGQRLGTTFLADDLVGLGNGAALYLSLTADAPVVLTGMDVGVAFTNGLSALDIYARPGAFEGFEQTAGEWHLVSSATILNGTTPAIVQLPAFAIGAGETSLALCYGSGPSGASPLVTTGTGANQSYATAIGTGPEMLTLRAGSGSTSHFGGTLTRDLVWNGALYFQPGPGPFATMAAYGDGCPMLPESFYETFAAGALDLGVAPGSTRVIRGRFNGDGYVVRNAAAAFSVPPGGTDLQLGDDAVSNPISLPFALQLPDASSTNAIRVCSNGFVWLDPTETTAPYQPTSGDLLTFAARLAPCWTDLNPQQGGAVHYHDNGSNAAYVTWLGVPNYNQTNSHTFQLALFGNGNFEFRYREMGGGLAAVSGYSLGNGAADPGPVDLTQALPVSIGPSAALTLTASGRPVSGSTLTITTSEIPPSAQFGGLGLTLVAFGRRDPGVPFGPIGPPGCSSLLLPPAESISPLFPAPAGPFSWSLSIPPGFDGLEFYLQSYVFSGIGLTASNGLAGQINAQ